MMAMHYLKFELSEPNYGKKYHGVTEDKNDAQDWRDSSPIRSYEEHTDNKYANHCKDSCGEFQIQDDSDNTSYKESMMDYGFSNNRFMPFFNCRYKDSGTMSKFSLDKMVAAYMDEEDEYIVMRGSKESHWVMYRRMEKEDMPIISYSVYKDLDEDIELIWMTDREPYKVIKKLLLIRKDQEVNDYTTRCDNESGKQNKEDGSWCCFPHCEDEVVKRNKKKLMKFSKSQESE